MQAVFKQFVYVLLPFPFSLVLNMVAFLQSNTLQPFPPIIPSFLILSKIYFLFTFPSVPFLLISIIP